MSKSLTKPEKLDAKGRIEKMLSGEDILLTSEEEKILARWEYANKLLESKEWTWPEIRQKIAEEFSVTRWTAENDITSAQEIFGRARRISKRYLLHLHLDRMDRDIERIRKGIFMGDDGAYHTPDDKEILALAKLHDAYTKALNAIPEENAKLQLPPPVMIFNLPNGTTLPVSMSFEEAMKAADEYIDYLEINKDGAEDRPTDQGNHDAAAAHDGEADPGE